MCLVDNFNNSEKPIASLEDRWWPRKAKQEGDKTSQTFYVIYIRKKRNERPNIGGGRVL